MPCTCEVEYLGQCPECDDGNEDCWACVDGFVDVSETEYLMERESDRAFIIVHQAGCDISDDWDNPTEVELKDFL